jgi:hypothetical protein
MTSDTKIDVSLPGLDGRFWRKADASVIDA